MHRRRHRIRAREIERRKVAHVFGRYFPIFEDGFSQVRRIARLNKARQLGRMLHALNSGLTNAAKSLERTGCGRNHRNQRLRPASKTAFVVAALG